jgi:hypothetical protein
MRASQERSIACCKLMAVPFDSTRGLTLGRPVALFDTSPYFFGGVGRNYDVSPDGTRFVMVKPLTGAENRTLHVQTVLNWSGGLRQR